MKDQQTQQPHQTHFRGVRAVIFRFDRFQADDTAFRLSVDGTPVPLEPKTLRLLLYLLDHRGRLVRKQELLDAVWPDTAVTENALTRSIGLLRKTLDDDSREPRFIETVPTAGYRFIAPVSTTPAPQAPATVTPEPARKPTPGAHSRARVFGLTGFSGRPGVTRLAAIVAVCVVVLAVGAWLVTKRLHAAPAIRSLAVLPLNNLSGNPAEDYFADGMTDELITELARIPNLRVVSRTSVMADRDQHLPLPVIARRLNVDAIVEGSTVRSGDRVRITAQLIDARTDRHLWAESFEGPATDVLSLQDSVARQIAAQARLVLLPSPPRPPINPAAHDAYLRGLYFFHKQDFPHSIEYFQQAIALDPSYASAWAGYASALEAGTTFRFGAPNQVMPKALAAAQRAIQLDPQNGEAYTALGSIQTIYEWNWTAAEQNLTRGIALNPSDAIAEFKYATFLDAVDRPQEAVTHMRRAVALDPLSFLMNRRLGATLHLARDYDGALAQLNRAAEMEDRPGSVDYHLSLVYEQKGMHDQAVDHDLAAVHDDDPAVDVAALRSTYQQHGWQPYWRARTQALLSPPPRSCIAYQVAVDDLRINELDAAFASFNQALDEHCFPMALIRVDPLLDSVRNDPRYAALLTRLHQ
jgi:TolB-like protein/DNA-binding winged helix-turn-helix (wHTH) protein/Flp pilus assembly protein TadD